MRAVLPGAHRDPAAARAEEEIPPSGLVAVANGYGLVKLFRSLGARIVSGGQTANPSVQDIVDAVRSVSAEKVIILPNNKNIVPTAERVGELVGVAVRVVPTRSIAAGLAATVDWYRENEDWWRPLVEAKASERRGIAA